MMKRKRTKPTKNELLNYINFIILLLTFCQIFNRTCADVTVPESPGYRIPSSVKEGKKEIPVSKIDVNFPQSDINHQSIPSQPNRTIVSQHEGETKNNVSQNSKVRANEDSPSQTVVSENIPSHSAVSEDIPPQPAVSENIPSHSAVSEDIPPQPVVNKDIPPQPAVSEDIPSKPAVNEDTPFYLEVHDDIPSHLEVHHEDIPSQLEDNLSQLDGVKADILSHWDIPADYQEDMNSNDVIPRHCADEMFQCDNLRCIPKSYKCDKNDDCGDGSDEHSKLGGLCAVKVKKCETSTEFDCGDGKCIPAHWLCDTEIDCKSTEADEAPEICNSFECKADQFTCHGNGSSCIPLNWVCDNKSDCDDSSDEYNCNATCTSEQFTCASGKCIPKIWHCDGDNDCDDGSDENECPVKECNGHEVKCPDGQCIQRSWVCDGTRDCTSSWDEHNCNATVHECEEGEIKCDRVPQCIVRTFLCDGDKDCPDGEDEGDRYCAGPSCPSDSFMCGDTACIPRDRRCNGFTECIDGSDEKDCNSTRCNPRHEFDCGDKCIAMSLVCNGQNDCTDGRDEMEDEKCNRNECAEHNGGCSQICVDTKAGHYCECKHGFMLIDGPHRTHCQDINECMEPGICSQICRNLKGSYKCECVAGYAKDPHNKHRCKAMEGHASLLFADYTDIRKISLDHQEITAIVNETDGSTALDFVFKTGMIFWTDVRNKCIYKAPIDEGLKKEVVIKGDMTNTDGLAVDWLYNHIYWTNSENNTVEVADFNGNMRKSIFHNELGRPRAIAIYPIEGWMFWTDWGKEPKIERAGMDGSFRQAIVTRNIRWPNGLTIDYVLRKIYWVDSKKHTISSCNFDGSKRRVILFSKEQLAHPFSITVFEDTLYWTDWTREAILKANKFSGADLQVVSQSHASPMTVHVYHSYRQPNGTNRCTPLNGLCTHLCLPAPQINPSGPKITCACPDGLVLMSDGLTCEHPEKLSTGQLDIDSTRIEIPTLAHGNSRLEIATPTHENTKLEIPILSHANNLEMMDDPVQVNPEEKRAFPPGLKNEELPSDDANPFASGNPSGNDDGSVAVAAILAAIVVLCITSAMAYLLYRYYRKRSVNSMNFDNPVYKKTTTTEDGFNMASGRTQAASTQNGVSRPPQHRQYGVVSAQEDGLCDPMVNTLKF